LKDYLAMALSWRESTPEKIISDLDILRETVRIAESEFDAAEASDMEVAADRVYGIDNSTFADRSGWE